MNIKQFIAAFGRGDLAVIAGKTGTTLGYLSEQVANGHRKPSPELAKKLVEASSGRLTLFGLRPDLWPEEPATPKRRTQKEVRP